MEGPSWYDTQPRAGWDRAAGEYGPSRQSHKATLDEKGPARYTPMEGGAHVQVDPKVGLEEEVCRGGHGWVVDLDHGDEGYRLVTVPAVRVAAAEYSLSHLHSVPYLSAQQAHGRAD